MNASLLSHRIWQPRVRLSLWPHSYPTFQVRFGQSSSVILQPFACEGLFLTDHVLCCCCCCLAAVALLQEQAAEAAAAAAGTVPGLDGPTQAGPGSTEVDRNHPVVHMLARLAAARAAAQARRAGISSSAATGASSSSTDVIDVEMQQARDARSRLGRDATFWAPVTAAAGDNGAQQQEEQQSTEAAAAQRMASLRALMGAIRASAMREQSPARQQPHASSDSTAAGSSSGAGTSGRQGMV